MQSVLIDAHINDLEVVGTEDQWHCDTKNLTKDSVILCAGVGGAITFERELARKIGCNILLLDPSPTGIQTMSRIENQTPYIEFMPIGLAAKDGKIGFSKPDNLAEGSWKVSSVSVDDYFSCRSVSSLMLERKFTQIDLLKIDIEGFEYEVIDEIIDSKLNVKQICVEFHDSSIINIKKSRYDMFRYVKKIRANGYKFVHMRHTDFTFIKC
jgi:FkbM family methyltransferase